MPFFEETNNQINDFFKSEDKNNPAEIIKKTEMIVNHQGLTELEKVRILFSDRAGLWSAFCLFNRYIEAAGNIKNGISIIGKIIKLLQDIDFNSLRGLIHNKENKVRKRFFVALVTYLSSQLDQPTINKISASVANKNEFDWHLDEIKKILSRTDGEAHHYQKKQEIIRDFNKIFKQILYSSLPIMKKIDLLMRPYQYLDYDDKFSLLTRYFEFCDLGVDGNPENFCKFVEFLVATIFVDENLKDYYFLSALRHMQIGNDKKVTTAQNYSLILKIFSFFEKIERGNVNIPNMASLKGKINDFQSKIETDKNFSKFYELRLQLYDFLRVGVKVRVYAAVMPNIVKGEEGKRNTNLIELANSVLMLANDFWKAGFSKELLRELFDEKRDFGNGKISFFDFLDRKDDGGKTLLSYLKLDALDLLGKLDKNTNSEKGITELNESSKPLQKIVSPKSDELQAVNTNNNTFHDPNNKNNFDLNANSNPNYVQDKKKVEPSPALDFRNFNL